MKTRKSNCRVGSIVVVDYPPWDVGTQSAEKKKAIIVKEVASSQVSIKSYFVLLLADEPSNLYSYFREYILEVLEY